MSYLGLLRRERDFRRVYTAQLLSLAGDWFAIVPLLALLPKLTGTGIWGALVLAADTLVFALLSPYAGTLVDRLDRRRIMVAADVVSAVLVLLLLLVRSPATAWIALVAVGGVAAAKAFYSPAVSAAVPNLVDPPDLHHASVLNGAAWGTTLFVGAALGGLFADLFGARACFVIDAVSFLVSAWLTARTARPFGEARVARHASVRSDLAETAAYARREHRVLALLVAKLGPSLGGGAMALLPLFAADVYAAGETGTGLFFAARGVGALLGPLLLRPLVGDDDHRLLPALAFSISVFGVGYMLLPAMPWFALALLAVVVAHMGGGANWIMSTYGLQRTVPDALRGRVFSTDYMIATLGMALSHAVSGVLADRYGPRVVSLGLGCLVVGYAVAWFTATRRLRAPLDRDALVRREAT